ncbi:MAG: hypothetical protein VX589_07035 [Myxococcota bacterium]|nr:hypothetical protein [Myxococcota bacterium]
MAPGSAGSRVKGAPCENAGQSVRCICPGFEEDPELCLHLPTNMEVALETCSYGDTEYDTREPNRPNGSTIDPLSSPDPITGQQRKYYQTKGDYQRVLRPGVESGFKLCSENLRLSPCQGCPELPESTRPDAG